MIRALYISPVYGYQSYLHLYFIWILLRGAFCSHFYLNCKPKGENLRWAIWVNQLSGLPTSIMNKKSPRLFNFGWWRLMLGVAVCFLCEFLRFWPQDGTHSSWQHHNQIDSMYVSEKMCLSNFHSVANIWYWEYSYYSLTIDTCMTNTTQSVSLETIL